MAAKRTAAQAAASRRNLEKARAERNMRAARRQLELFMDDGIRERITVALALLDENVENAKRRPVQKVLVKRAK